MMMNNKMSCVSTWMIAMMMLVGTATACPFAHESSGAEMPANHPKLRGRRRNLSYDLDLLERKRQERGLTTTQEQGERRTARAAAELWEVHPDVHRPRVDGPGRPSVTVRWAGRCTVIGGSWAERGTTPFDAIQNTLRV